MKSEHSKWMKTTEIRKLKDYILNENNVDPNFLNIRIINNVDAYLREIIRFLILKSLHRDFNALQLSPLSKEIDDVWHCFLLHTQDYQSFVNKMTLQYCKESHFIHHNPMGALETTQRQERLERTKMVYISRYNTLPSICLPPSIEASNMNKRKREPLEEITDEPVKQKEKIKYTIYKKTDQNKSEDFITITFKSWIGDYVDVDLRACHAIAWLAMACVACLWAEGWRGGGVEGIDGCVCWRRGKIL